MHLTEPGAWKEGVALCIRLSARPIHFVGVGNTLRRDDAAGVQVVSSLGRRLGHALPPWVKLHTSEAPERTLSGIPPGDGVVLFDAVRSKFAAGSVVCTTLDDTRYGFFATHNIPLRLIPGLAERQDTAYVIGIEPESIEVGEGLSPAVERSVDALVTEVMRLVRAGN